MNSMLLIGDILVDETIATARFSCDVAQCKGSCCTLAGGGGAPLTDEEAQLLPTLYAVVAGYLPEHSGGVARTNPVSGSTGDFSTTCINERECCFAFYENDVAKCSIERAYFEGKTAFRKPLSCHLFPVREGSFGGAYLYYERIGECASGRSKGEREGVFLLDELQPPLARAYGEEWVATLRNTAVKLRTQLQETTAMPREESL